MQATSEPSVRQVSHASSALGANDCSRRQFLKQGSLAVAASVVATPPLVAADTAPKRIRLGVVGGGFGCSFQWHEHPDCVVQAVSDLRADRRERLMKVYKCTQAYPSLEELVKDPNLDAVAVFTDGPLHVQHVVECMRHGKHAISAVPAAWGSLEEAELLLATVKQYGLTYMMAETGYYQQSTMSARKFYQEGKFGTLYYCEAEYQHPGLEVLYFSEGKRTWRFRDRNHRVASGSSLDDVRIKIRKNGEVRFRAGGRKVQLATPGAGALEFRVGFRNAQAGDEANQCAAAVKAFRSSRRGAIRYP